MTDHGDYVELTTGAHMPKVGLGTWSQTNVIPGKQGSDSHLMRDAVVAAVKAGYRHIDTAWAYYNEKEIGEALAILFKEGVVKREDLFITTKLFAFFFREADVEKALRGQLADLGLDYVDMYLVHVPIAFKRDPNDPKNIFPMEGGKPAFDFVDHLDTWKGMEGVYKKGLAKQIGVSNYSAKQIQNLIDHGTVAPHNLQVECHAYFPQEKLLKFCKDKKIAFTAYSSLGSPGYGITTPGQEHPSIMNDPVVQGIAKKHNKTAAQVLLRNQYQRGIITIPKSSNPDRLRSNFQIFDFSLDDADQKAIEGLDTKKRILGARWIFFKDHPQYPFGDDE